ncbi:MAG: DUF4350 domain-containing protein [Polyangiaceae bacterium]
MKRAFALFLWAFVMLFSLQANATLDPARAAGDASSVAADHRAFCTHPPPFLSPDAKRLCDYSKQIPNCQPYADACDALEPKPSSFPAWLTSALDWIAKTIAKLAGLLGWFGVWVVAGIVLGLVLYPLIQAVTQSRREKRDDADAIKLPALPSKTQSAFLKLSRDEDPTRVLEEANLLAQQGKLDHALYRYLHAALLSLDKNGAIVIAREKTHGEYVRACSDSEAKPPLRDLVREIEVVRFGGREPSMGGVSVAQERATWIVKRAMAAAVMLTVFFLTGCQQQISGNDPGGSDTLRALLEKQNVEVKTLFTPLAKIPIPTPKNRETTAALYVDVDRIPLEDDAQEHLLRWVDAGGILILAGSPTHWPKALGAKVERSTSLDISVTTYKEEKTKKTHSDEDEESGEADDDDDESTLIPRVDNGKLAHVAAVSWVDKGTFVLASTHDEKDFVVGELRGAGAIYAAASDEPFTNAGLAIPGNATAAIAILSNVPRQKYLFAPVGAGFSPPTNPFAGLINAGLGLPLLHGFFATIILFFAVGVRLAAARPDAPPRRRAFTEHIYATAAIYGRTKSAKHALASFGRYAENRLAKRLGRGAPDIVTLLSQRSGEPIEVCAVVWGRALVAREAENDPPNGDELKILRKLTSIYSRAMQ